MRASELQPFLEALDYVLQPLGFRRSGQSQEWRKSATSRDVAWIHLNAGRAVLNPSLGVAFPDIAELLPDGLSENVGTMRMLSTLFTPARAYSSDTAPEDLARDLLDRGLVEIDHLLDRESVIRDLQSTTARDWPTPSYSHRIRLLPLLLVSMGKRSEALEVARSFASQASPLDQMLPSYSAFLQAFETRFAA